MKHFLAAAGLLCLPAVALAQITPSRTVSRGDAAFTLGWLNGNKSDVTEDRYNDWYNRGVYGAGHIGWYWSDHHKTELEFGGSTAADLYTGRTIVVGSLQTFQSLELSFRTRRVAIGQQYQFYRNAWFHPHVTGGADLIWETTREDVTSATTYDQVTRISRAVPPPPATGPHTKLRVQPFAEVGFKTYMTPRTFFRGDIRITARDRFDQVLLRCGFGVDF